MRLPNSILSAHIPYRFFDGEYISVPSDTDFDISGSPFSVMVRASWDTATPSAGVIFDSEGASDLYRLKHDGTNLVFEIYQKEHLVTKSDSSLDQILNIMDSEINSKRKDFVDNRIPLKKVVSGWMSMCVSYSNFGW